MSLITPHDHCLLVDPAGREAAYGQGSDLAGAVWIPASEKPELSHETKLVKGRVSGIRADRRADIHSAASTAEIAVKSDLTVETALFNIASVSGNASKILDLFAIVEPPAGQHEFLSFSAALADDRAAGPFRQVFGLACTEYSFAVEEGEENGIETEAKWLGSGRVEKMDPAPAVPAQPAELPCLLHRHLGSDPSSWSFGAAAFEDVRKIEVGFSAQSEQDRFGSRYARRLILKDGPNPSVEVKVTVYAGASGLYDADLEGGPVYVEGIDLKLALAEDHYLRLQIPVGLITEASQAEDVGAAVRELTVMPVDGGQAAAAWTATGKTPLLNGLLGAI